MKTSHFIPLEDYSMDASQFESLDSLDRETLIVASLMWALQRLAELAGAAAALMFYFSLVTSDPAYMGWLPLLVYLGQGVYLMRKEVKKTGLPSDIIGWGWVTLSVLSWPVHFSLVNFHAELIRADARFPNVIIDGTWIRLTLLFVVLRWGANWAFPWILTTSIGFFIDQAGLLP